MQTELLTLEETAVRLRVTYLTVYRMVRDGKLRGIRVGRLWRVPRVEVDRLIDGSPRPGY